MKVLAAQLAKPDTRHTIEEYLKMFISAAETLLGVFGYVRNKICAQVMYHERQT